MELVNLSSRQIVDEEQMERIHARLTIEIDDDG
jgi:hypothetical protein